MSENNLMNVLVLEINMILFWRITWTTYNFEKMLEYSFNTSFLIEKHLKNIDRP